LNYKTRSGDLENPVVVAKSSGDPEQPFDLSWSKEFEDIEFSLAVLDELSGEIDDELDENLRQFLETIGVEKAGPFNRTEDFLPLFLSSDLLRVVEKYPEDEDWYDDSMDYSDMPRIPTSVSVYCELDNLIKVEKSGSVLGNILNEYCSIEEFPLSDTNQIPRVIEGQSTSGVDDLQRVKLEGGNLVLSHKPFRITINQNDITVHEGGGVPA
jgi:hypothetical protein